MLSLVPVDSVRDILPVYRGTPFESLLRYHNLEEPFPPGTGEAEMLIGMCMDNRKDLRIPARFAYIIRAAGANLRGSEFEISYAIAIAGVLTVCIIAHTDCGMANVNAKREAFARGLVEWGGCNEEDSLRHFDRQAPNYEIGDPAEFVVSEAVRIQNFYPKVLVAPLLYDVRDDRLSQINAA